MAIEKSEFIWHNGKLIPWDDARLHVMSHVVHYGSSVFEGIRCYAPPGGPAVFRATEHMQRLLDSAKVYRMDVEYTRDQLVKAMLETVAGNGAWPCYVRPIIFRGYGEAGVTALNTPTEVYIINYPFGYLGGESEACDVCVSSWTRIAPNTLPAMAKSGANYMNSQLIKMEANVNGFAEGIALDVNGFVSEGGQGGDWPHHQGDPEGVLRHRARGEERPPRLAHSGAGAQPAAGRKSKSTHSGMRIVRSQPDHSDT
jgi:branched-chain amino acid aminotransferase